MSQPRFESSQTPETCPNCSSAGIVRIKYGHPVCTDEQMQEIEAGKVVWTCIVPDDPPEWFCRECGVDIFRKPE